MFLLMKLSTLSKALIKKGKSDHYYMNIYEDEVLWDYRDYDVKFDNTFLKAKIEEIDEAHSYFEQFMENVTYD